MCINEKIVEMLKKNKLLISTMESCTGGNILNQITNIEGASRITNGGFVTYSNQQKIKMGVSKEVIEKYGVYSPECARAMANAALNNIVSDIGIGVTGTFSNLDTDNLNSNLGLIFYCISYSNRINRVNKRISEGQIQVPNMHRHLQKQYVTDVIFNSLYDLLRY